MIIDEDTSIGRETISFLESIGGFVVKKNVILSKSVKNNCAKFVWSGNKYRNLSKDDDVNELVEKLRERLEKIEGFSGAFENDEEGVELEGFHQFVERENDEDGDDTSCSNGGYKRVFANVEYDVLKIPDNVEPKVKKTVRFNDNGNVYTVYSETDESNSNEDGCLTYEIDSNDDRAQAIGEFLCESDGTKRSSKSDEVKMKNRRDDWERKAYCWDQDGNLLFSASMPVKMEPRTDLTKKKKAVQILT